MTSTQNEGHGRTLTAKERAFCREYVQDFNAAAAARRAGYSEKAAKQQANKLLSKPSVMAEIKALTQAAADRADITTDEIIRTLTNLARGDIRNALSWGYEDQKVIEGEGEGAKEITVSVPFVRPVSSADLSPAMAAAISSVSLSDKGTFTLKMHDKNAALDKLMRHLGLYEADNKQKTDPLTALIASAQGTALPIASRHGAATALAQAGGNE